MLLVNYTLVALVPSLDLFLTYVHVLLLDCQYLKNTGLELSTPLVANGDN